MQSQSFFIIIFNIIDFKDIFVYNIKHYKIYKGGKIPCRKNPLS